MAFDANSTIGDILKEKPNAKEVLERHAAMTVDPAQLAIVEGMTIQQVAGYIGWSQEKIDALLKDVNEL